MPKKQLTVIQRTQIVMSFKFGTKISILANHFNVTCETIKNIVKKGLDNQERKKYSSDTRFKLTEQNNIEIENELLENSSKTPAKIINDLKLPVHPKTLKRRIKKLGYKCYVQKKRTKIDDECKKARLEFARGT